MIFSPCPPNVKQLVLIKDGTCHACLSNWEIHLKTQGLNHLRVRVKIQHLLVTYQSCLVVWQDNSNQPASKFHRAEYFPALIPHSTRLLITSRDWRDRVFVEADVSFDTNYHNQPLTKIIHSNGQPQSAKCVHWQKLQCPEEGNSNNTCMQSNHLQV